MPLLDPRKIVRVELVLLDQDLLPDPDLPEIVEQARVAKLPHLLDGEPDQAVGPVGTVHRPGQPDGEVGDPLGVPRGGGIALLDGGDRGPDEALEEPLDLLVQLAVLQRHGGLAGQ